MTGRPQPELLGRLKTGQSAFGHTPARRLLSLLGDGGRHLVGPHAVAAAERLRVYDLGVTVRSFASVRLPPGPSFWEWVPEGSERLPALHPSHVPDRAGFLVVADPSGQRGILHFMDHKPLARISGHTLALPCPVSMTFDISDEPRHIESLFTHADVADYRAMPLLPAEEQTALSAEASPVDEAYFNRRFGAVVSPLYRGDAELCLSSDTASYTEEDWDRVIGMHTESLTEALMFFCLQLVLTGSDIERWSIPPDYALARRGGPPPRPATGYETTIL